MGAETFSQDAATLVAESPREAVPTSDEITRRDDADIPPVDFRKIFVPADDFDRWPEGDWQPMSIREFLEGCKLLRRESPGPQPVWIERAEYSAVFVEQVLQSGRGRWIVARQAEDPQFLDVEPLNLAVSDFQSTGNDAVWGTAPSGGNVLLVPDNRLTAEFTWQLDGAPRRHSVVFDVRIPPATISILQLMLPEGMQARSSVGEVTGPRPGSDLGWNKWEIDLGQATSCRLTVHETLPAAAASPQWLVRQQTSYVVRQEGTEIFTDLNLENTGAATDRLQVHIPPDVDVYAVSYGNDASVAWSAAVDSVTNENMLTISLPDPVRGALRPIRISSFVEAIVDREWELPMFRLPGLFLQGNIQLTIEPPLQLNEITTKGCRLQQTSTGSTTGTTYQLIQNDSGAGVAIHVAFPAVQLSARVLHHLTHESSDWSWTAEVSLRGRSGSTYQIRSLLPVRWDIAEVQVVGSPADAGQTLKWTTEPATADHQWLVLDVAKAIDADHPLSVRLRAKQTPGTAEDVLRFPFIDLQDGQLSDAVYAVHFPGQDAPHEQLADGMQPTTVQSVGETWGQSPLYQSLRDNTQPARWYASTLNSGEGTRLEFPQGLTVTAAVEYDFLADRLIEQFFVAVEPVSEPIDRILVYVSGSGPEFEWEQLADRVIPVDSQRLQTERHHSWNLPEKGELWEIRLPVATQGPIRLRAQRVRYHAGEANGQLVFLPQSRSFRGTIELNSPKGIDVETATNARILQRRDVISQDGLPDPPATVSYWEYDDVSDAFAMQVKPGLESGAANPAAMVHLQSRVFVNGAGENRHRARFEMMGDVRAVEFVYELPPHVDWIATRVNGEDVQPQYRGNQHVVSLTRSIETGTHTPDGHGIEVEYQERAAPVWLRDRVRIPLPRVEIPVIQFDWDMELPRGYVLEEMPSGINAVNDVKPFGWRTRWFGPLSRSAGDGGFNPFDSGDWRDLYHRLRRDFGETRPEDSTSEGTWNRIRLQGRQLPVAPSLVVWNIGRLTWIGWMALWGTLLVGGAARVYASGRFIGWIGIAWWSLLVAAVWFVPEPLSIVTGAITFGSLVIALLPALWMQKSWFVDRRIVRESSDSDATSPIADVPSGITGRVTMMALLVLSLAINAVAQNESGVPSVPPSRNASEPAPSSTAVETWDVLVPFSNEDEDGSQIDLVYLNSGHARKFAEYLSRLQRRGVDYLITSAAYAGRWDRDRPFVIEATFRIAVFAEVERATTIVRLPVRHAHLASETACLVDGEPHPIFSVPDRDGFTLELRSLPPQPHSPSLPEEKESIAAGDRRSLPTVQFREVTLYLYPAVRQVADGGRFRLEIPPVAQSQLRLDFAEPPSVVRVKSDHGDGLTTHNTASISTSLGRQSDVDVEWKWQPVEPVPVVVEATHQSLLEFSPTVVRGTSRIHYRLKSGEVSDLLWDAPDGIVIEQASLVGTNAPVSFDLFLTANGSRRVLIEFTEPMTADFSLEVDWLSPVAADGSGRISISPPAWMGRSVDEAVSVELDDVQAAVSGLPGYELLSSPDEHMVLRDIPADEFYSLWDDESMTRPSALVSSFDPDSRIAFELRPLRSVRKARQDETLHFTRQRVNWDAKIEVETSQTPALVHDIVLDSAIQLEEVSVEQDGAERLSHFIRDGDRLKLILKDLTSSTQVIRLSGFFPAMIDAEIFLPRVQYQADVMDRTTVAVRHDAGLRLELLPDEQWTEFSAEQDVVPADVDWKTRGRFLRQSVSSPAEQSIRMTVESVRSLELAHVLALKPMSGKSWTMRMLWHVEPSNGDRTALRIELPAEIAAPNVVAGSNAVIAPAEGTDGGNVATFTPDADDLATQTVIIEGEWTIKGDGPWTLPRARLTGGDVVERWLMISPRDVMQPLEGNERQVPEEIPLWSRPALEAFFPGNLARLFHKAEGDWVLAPSTSRDQQVHLAIPWMRTECRFDASTGCLGRTEICVESAPGRVLRIEMPPSARLVAVLLNGATLSAKISDGGELQIPLGTPNSSAAVNLIDVVWQQPFDDSWRVVLHANIDLPRAKEFSPERHFVEIISSSRQHRLAMVGIAPRDSLEYHLDVAERISAQLQQAEESAQDENQHLRQTLQSELRYLSDSIDAGNGAFERTPSVASRWRSLVNLHESDLNEAASTFENRSTWLSTAAHGDGATAGDIVLGERNGEALDTPIALWWIDSRWYGPALAVFAFGLTAFVLRKLSSWLGPFPRGLPAPLFAVVLTLVWWLFLGASVLGFVLFLAALYAWWNWRRTMAPRRTARPVS